MTDYGDWIRSLNAQDRIRLRVLDWTVDDTVDTDFDASDLDEISAVVAQVGGESDSVPGSYTTRVVFGEEVMDEMHAEQPHGRLTYQYDLAEYELDLNVTAEIDMGIASRPVNLKVEPVFEDGGSSASDENEVSVPSAAREYRDRALERTGRMRLGTMRRVVLADAVVSYVADAGAVGVWGEYQLEADEPSVSGFLSVVTAREFAELLGNYGSVVFPDRTDELDVSQRTARDVLEALMYFRAEGE